MDPRHLRRIRIIQELYSEQFIHQKNLLKKTKLIIDKYKIIDEKIAKYAIKFPLEKIAKIDLAILRLATFELIIEKKEPAKVIINEAVELAKELGNEKSYSFINAVLGKIYEEFSRS